MAIGIAARLELLEMRELADVDLSCQVPADRLLECLAGIEVAAREGPVPRERLLRALPEQHLQLSCADLEDHGEGRV
jgi:hypothetical protein